MARLEITTSDSTRKDATEAALAVLRSHTVKSGGVVTEDRLFPILAYVEDKLVGGMIGKVLELALRRPRLG